MPGLSTLGIVILYLMSLFYPLSAMAFTTTGQATQKGAHSKAPSKASPAATSSAPSKASPATTSSPSPPSVQREVVNIVVDRVEGASIYSKDWRTFKIPSSAKVIDNSHRVTKMRTAELVFENGSLVAVTLK
ncbi:MAG: hypothetical protein ACLQVJ_23535 [Syntrophobacteraceae bacterium]